MNAWLFIIPLITGVLGLCLNSLAAYFIFNRLLPARQQELSAGIAQFAASQLSLTSMLEEKIAHPGNFQKLMPVIEEKIDHFLRVKLKEAMPVVGMFVGDKTIQQLKTVFVDELQIIFPAVMKSYASHLQEEFDLKRLISDKLSSIPPETLVSAAKTTLRKEIRSFGILGFISGLLLGTIALVLVLLLQ